MLCIDDGKVWGEESTVRNSCKNDSLKFMSNLICSIEYAKFYASVCIKLTLVILKPDINVDSVFYVINI